MENKFAVFKIHPGAQPQSLHRKAIPDFSKSIKDMGEFDFSLLDVDVSDVNLSDAGEALKVMSFDNNVVFPGADKLPDGFVPNKILESGKDPGLGVRELHERGITGCGVTIAIIDNPLDTAHQEIKDNLIHYESIGYPSDVPLVANMHATAVSSLACGKSIGVAPDAKLVYFAANFYSGAPDEKPFVHSDHAGKQWDIYFSNYAKALRKILFMNLRLPEDKRISAVSISWGMLGKSPECTELINELINSGVLVLTTDPWNFYGEKACFSRIHRTLNSDPNSVGSYEYDRLRGTGDSNRILVPAGGRTLAGFCGHDNYVYTGTGGLSWSTPYLVGVYAMAKQVYPNLTPDHFFDVVRSTGQRKDADSETNYDIVIQPQKVIAHLQNELLLQRQSARDME